MALVVSAAMRQSACAVVRTRSTGCQECDGEVAMFLLRCDILWVRFFPCLVCEWADRRPSLDLKVEAFRAFIRLGFSLCLLPMLPNVLDFRLGVFGYQWHCQSRGQSAKRARISQTLVSETRKPPKTSNKNCLYFCGVRRSVLRVRQSLFACLRAFWRCPADPPINLGGPRGYSTGFPGHSERHPRESAAANIAVAVWKRLYSPLHGAFAVAWRSLREHSGRA